MFIRPFGSADDRKLVKDTKIVTVIVGVASCLCGIYASSILSLLSKAYSFAGAGIVPLICIGLVWKERSDTPHAMGKRNSRATPWGARSGIVVGAVVSQLSVFGDYATLVGVAASSVCIVLVSLLTKNVHIEPVFASEGNVAPLEKPHAED